MYSADIYDKILFIALVCSSFFIVLYSVSMNKKASLFKLLGTVFFIPFGICCSIFIFSAHTTISLALSLSEFCLSLGILLLLIDSHNTKNYYFKVLAIAGGTIALAIYTIQSDQFIFYTLTDTFRYFLIAACVAGAIIFNIKKDIDQKLIIPLVIWLASILLGFAEKLLYIKEVMFLLKLSTNIAFIYYFYSMIYEAYMKKISDSQNLIERMEHSLNSEVKKRVFEIEKSNERLLEISKMDLLTKTLNKITILNVIEKLISSKKENAFSILMFDIDNFKVINDSLGHVTGDMCLKTLALIASSNIREVDHLGRYGGDEFIIVLPTLEAKEAKFVAERFRKKINETSNPRFTVSIGIATYPSDGQTVKDLISAADKGLYKAKSKGKNAISHATLF